MGTTDQQNNTSRSPKYNISKSPKKDGVSEAPFFLKRNQPFFKASEQRDGDNLENSEEFRTSANNNLYTKEAQKLKKSNFILRSVNKEDLLMSKENGLNLK